MAATEQASKTFSNGHLKCRTSYTYKVLIENSK